MWDGFTNVGIHILDDSKMTFQVAQCNCLEMGLQKPREPIYRNGVSKHQCFLVKGSAGARLQLWLEGVSKSAGDCDAVSNLGTLLASTMPALLLPGLRHLMDGEAIDQ